MHVLLMVAFVLVGQVLAPQKPIKKENSASLKASQSKGKTSNNRSAAVPTATQPTQPTPQSHQTNDHTPADDRVYKVELEKVPPDRWIRAYVFITGLLALGNIGILFFMWQQRNLMKDQLGEMQKTREKTDALATRAAEQVTEMQNAGIQTGRMIEHAEAQVSALTTAASAALKNAESVEKQLGLMSKATGQTEKLIEHADNQTKALIAAAEIALQHSKATASVAEATKLAAEATAESAKSADITAEFTRDAAITAKKSADAAKATAESLINSERPWIIPKIRKKVRWIDSLGTDEDNFGKPIKKRVVYFTFSISNHGRTPAEVFAIRGNPRLTEKGIDGGLQDPPDYGTEYIFRQVRMLAPGQRWDYDDIDLDFREFDPETIKLLETFKMHRIFKGVVLYRDVFKPEEVHESRFCYTYFWMREAYLPSGPPDHTKYT